MHSYIGFSVFLFYVFYIVYMLWCNFFNSQFLTRNNSISFLFFIFCFNFLLFLRQYMNTLSKCILNEMYNHIYFSLSCTHVLNNPPANKKSWSYVITIIWHRYIWNPTAHVLQFGDQLVVYHRADTLCWNLCHATSFILII